MLFEEERPRVQADVRPQLPAGTPTDYKVGFLFNLVSGKSTRFDLEPLLIYGKGSATEYKRVSLQSTRALAFLQPLSDSLYERFLEFSDRRLIRWMDRTRNRYILNDSGSWAHVSARELRNLRRHYRDLLENLWSDLLEVPDVYILRTGRFNPGQLTALKLGREKVAMKFAADRQGNNIVLTLKILFGEREGKPALLGGFLLEFDGALYLPPDGDGLDIIDLFKNGPITFPLSVAREITNKYVTSWLLRYPVTISDKLPISLVEPAVEPRVRLSELNESNLMIRPEFTYGDFVVDYDDAPFHVAEHGAQITIIRRRKEEEKSVYEYLRTLHPSFSNQRNNHYYYLAFDDVMKRGWFITMLRRLHDNGYSIHGLPELRKFRYTPHLPSVSITATSAPDWFELRVGISWGDQHVPLREIRNAILNRQDTIMLDDGNLAHIPEEWIARYSLLFRTAKEEDGVLKVSKMHYTLLEEVLKDIDDAGVKEDIEARKRRLLEFDLLATVPVSKEIQATLRPYQVSGFNWLQTLDELGWGGCLADDMGLGKTLQTISFLQYLKEKYKGSTQLVICPTSLIFNWENELKKFCPGIRFHVYYGVEREFDETHFESYDVILTTYGVVRNDAEHLAGFLWQYIILDESQAIKNPDAGVTRALQHLRSVNRVILSGTPVQNNTSDLFAQFNFLNPGLLGTREFFNREFSIPIDKQGNRERTQYLKKIIHPFTLRRTKEQVARDLPDKTVTVLWCVMNADQRRLYNYYRDNYRNALLKRIDDEGISKSGMYVLEGLLRLRQICDHPSMAPPVDGETAESSVKLDELVREVRENAGNHKLLVFSQFTEMLQLIRAEFEESGISFCYLDGSTPLPKRQQEVTRFQEDPSVTVFLISLKAGGVGLNLTVADYVYLVDPWWNPAAEQQAIDRAHRIGQTRKVFAYKMICKDTVEEKILQLQERKKMLADDLIQEDGSVAKNLSREDIEFLFG